jgi:nicotinate-nucleotide adenylyltransferase
MRVGILGGTFDPPHNGHLALADAARAHFSLDLVLFIPAGQPWRKTREITPAEHRLEMLRLAIDENNAFGISDVELRRTGPTYTADTLDELAGERLDDMFWFIVGADALADLPNWHEPARIVRHAVIAVAGREGADVAAAIAAVPALKDRIETFPMPPADVSSTDIRARVARREPIGDLVPAAIATYIQAHRLYA